MTSLIHAVSSVALAADAETAIRAAETAEAAALLRGDAAALARMWASDLIITASNNKIRSGAEALQFVQSGQMRFSKLDRRIERVAVHGHVGIVMGEETFIPAAGDGAGKTLKRRFTDVLKEQGGSWQLIARQTTLID